MIAKEGYPFILTALVLTILFYIIPQFVWVILSLLLLLLFIWFFRDPEREIPVDKDIAVSAADGKVVELEDDVEFGGEHYKKVSVFMNLFSVHVNRAPVAGTVTSVEHIAGKFVNAARSDASIVNERNVISFNTNYGNVIAVQIAGLVARRTVSYVEEGSMVATGDKIGMIKFSSRVDHYFPLSANINVKLGEEVKAGESIIATFGEHEPAKKRSTKRASKHKEEPSIEAKENDSNEQE